MKNIISLFTFRMSTLTSAVLLVISLLQWHVKAFGFKANTKIPLFTNVAYIGQPMIGKTSVTSSTPFRLFSTPEAPEFEEDVALRFSGVGRLYHEPQSDKSCTVEIGNTAMNGDSTPIAIDEHTASEEKEKKPPHMEVIDRLSKSTVAIVGIGGVGSWAAEAICRSGVGNILLIDLDDICTSNINRQLHALSSTVGKMKIDEMRQRLLDINPTCNVTLIHDFIGVDNANDIVDSLLPEVDVILDAIDGANEKTALIAAACYSNVTVVTCGGAAGRIDPTKIICEDLTKSSQCRLLFRCKKLLRTRYKLFPEGMTKKQAKAKNSRNRTWRIWSVFSEEVVEDRRGGSEGGDSVSSLRTCDGPLGTACFVTGAYGFVAASKVVSMLANQELIKPRILKSALLKKNALQD
jgi:tRNA A37 threonylcarbamoyladenosine dehydratase